MGPCLKEGLQLAELDKACVLINVEDDMPYYPPCGFYQYSIPKFRLVHTTLILKGHLGGGISL